VTEKQQKHIWLLCAAVFLVFCAWVGWFIGIPMIRMAEEPDAFRLWVDSHGILGRIVFVGMVTIQVLVAFIPGEPVELLAGYAFGVIEGSLLTMAGFLLGSWLIFLLVRRFGVHLVEVFFSKEKISELGFLRNPKKAQVLAFILMSIPGTPKDFLSYFAGLTPLTLKQWLGIVAIARLPSLLTSTITGAAAGEENYLFSGIMLAITLLMSLLGILYYRRLTKKERQNGI
jgi:uncharacterized membrane protein YdjX (TVP38/TMEM64 family)